MENVEKVDILIVDDRMDGIIALEAVLSAPHINLVRAQSGQEALSLLADHDVAVILMDVQMPELDGFETAEIIRKSERNKHTPIIFVTAINKDDVYIYKGYQVGAVDYIFKPFEPQILRSKVSTFVDLFIKSRQLQEQAIVIRESERRDRHLRLAELEVESLKRYRNLADAIPHIVWKARADGALDYFNQGWATYTGLSAEQSIGSAWQSAVYSEDLVHFLKIWIHSMTSKKPFEVECRFRRADGELRWFWVRAVPEIHHSGEVIAWLGTCTDIHDRKLGESRLIDAEKAANSANTAKTHFLANMSHEIRTPLNAILGFAELILDPHQTEADRIESVRTIRRSGKQLLKLIDEILDISKVEAGHLEIERIDVNLGTLFSQLQSLLNVQARSKELQLRFHLKSRIPQFIKCDPTRLRQILLNVIGNSIKFTEKGMINVEIEWVNSFSEEPSQLRVRVIDTGVGIDEGQADKLFQPFIQVDSSTTRKFGGTGLGLALSRQLAAALGGKVELESSAPGQGSTFVIEIESVPVSGSPWLQNIEAQEQKEQSAFTERDSKVLKGVSILLVDDAYDNQVLISHFLKSAGAHVDLAENGLEGVDKAMSGSHEVVLMDIQMPKLDGYQATKQLRQQGYRKPIIALTAHAFKEERDRCFSVGCNDHLTKPIDRKLLINQVAKIIGQIVH